MMIFKLFKNMEYYPIVLPLPNTKEIEFELKRTNEILKSLHNIFTIDYDFKMIEEKFSIKNYLYVYPNR